MSDTASNAGGVRETPIVFPCDGDSLVGIVHRPKKPLEYGLVTIVAGGPQYRAGVGRGMVNTARFLADRGVAVLRFDYRGLGDSGGDFLGFEHIAQDIESAVSVLKREVPEVKKVVLWGGCDAASGAMIHSWKIPGADSLVLGNPWVTTHETHAAAMKQHYLSRLRQPSFWRKLFRLDYNLLTYARAGLQKAGHRVARIVRSPSGQVANAGADNFVDSMLAGLEKYEGPVLFLVSGQSVASREFDELISQDERWRVACSRPLHKRIDFPAADQTFSDKNSREAVNQTILDWIRDLAGV